MLEQIAKNAKLQSSVQATQDSVAIIQEQSAKTRADSAAL